jgi:hypothetical protein
MEKDSSIINKSLEIRVGTRTKAFAAKAENSPGIHITIGPNVWTKFYKCFSAICSSHSVPSNLAYLR